MKHLKCKMYECQRERCQQVKKQPITQRTPDSSLPVPIKRHNITVLRTTLKRRECV